MSGAASYAVEVKRACELMLLRGRGCHTDPCHCGSVASILRDDVI